MIKEPFGTVEIYKADLLFHSVGHKNEYKYYNECTNITSLDSDGVQCFVTKTKLVECPERATVSVFQNLS